MTDLTRAYHFTATTLRDDTPIPPVGEWLEHDGPLVMCKSGLHASEKLLDALAYAPGLTLHVVTLDGDVLRDDDKLVASRRRIESSRDVPLRVVVRLAIESACLAAWCAGRYRPELLGALEAADREDWAAARDAAADAAWDAAADAARAARAAARAARAAARAAGDAAGVAARAAWAVARDAARDAGDAAWAVARAARAAAKDVVTETLELRARVLMGVGDEAALARSDEREGGGG